MKVGYFTERPVRWIPEEVILRNGGHFAVSNSYFDRERAAEDYNYYIDENLYAEELGFDIVALNEHHGNPFCMGSVMNVEAGILARLTKKAKILLIGNPLPVIKHPLRMAEELAEIDLISRGRLISGWVRGRGQRAVLQQRESLLQPRVLRRGARFYRAGVDAAGAVALRGQAFPLPARESVGAAVSETASSDVDSGNAQPGDGAMVRGEGRIHILDWAPRSDRLAICGITTRTKRPSMDTKRGRRISATCCRPSWPRLKTARRSWARIFCSAVARTHSRASSIRCRPDTTRKRRFENSRNSRKEAGSESAATKCAGNPRMSKSIPRRSERS